MTRYLTMLWTLTYGVTALVWTVTGRGYPFGPNDPGNDLTLLRFVPTDTGALIFAVVMLAMAALTMAMGGRLARPARYAILTYGWLVALALLVIVPDVNVLALAGYAPMLIIGAPFGWPPVHFDQVINWPILNQLWCVLGGLLLARTLLLWQRPSWLAGQSPLRWAKPVTYLAAAIPLTYAMSRLAWLAGIPMGISPEMLRDLRETGAVWAGAGLGGFAVVGSVLTLGLIQRWGEVFPRWMIGLAGRRVPVMLAVVPALVVAVAVTSASVSLLSNARVYRVLGGSDSAAALPMLLWPIWGAALAAAAFAYYVRRRSGLLKT
ncbi:hypothetical protein Rhe02_80900 [Rhizocola hellebori]|uniref:Uncharacterized protein n=1 Tax=Rhizocola hellebori TaxID=1392758 RepID=A0A8J3QFK4_9ACTN|nr:hypothetical protein [Rhizocola hellebori]GIH10023.1 hypothetical protein Rhe02_80900 [Rhizocola hellebori]